MREPSQLEKALRDDLWTSMELGCGRQFMPRNRFHNLITRQSISGILRGQPEELTEWVIKEATTVFAILVLMNKSITHTRRCRSSQFNNQSLPLLDNIGSTGSNGSELPLDAALRARFVNYQWNFLPFGWTDKLPDKPEHIYSEMPLPFTSKNPETAGGFSTLFKCTVHNDHQQPPQVNIRFIMILGRCLQNLDR